MTSWRLKATWGCVMAAACSILIMIGCHRKAGSPDYDGSPNFRRAGFDFAAVQHTLADVFAEPDASSERLTQCIFGDVVRIDDETEWWFAVSVGPEPSLTGWMHKSELLVLPADATYIKERKLTTIIIRQNGSEVSIWPSQTIPIAIGTELPFIGENKEWYLVRLPNNDVGKISRKSVMAAQPAAQPLIRMARVEDQRQQAAPAAAPRRRQDRRMQERRMLERHEIIETAQQYVGKNYVWGGTTPRGFDCSGLTYFVFRLNGIELPRLSSLQYRTSLGQKVKKANLHEADLVFFETYRPGPSHVGIYIGGNRFIHASPKYGVTIGNLNDPYFKHRYIGAKTVFLRSS